MVVPTGFHKVSNHPYINPRTKWSDGGLYIAMLEQNESGNYMRMFPEDAWWWCVYNVLGDNERAELDELRTYQIEEKNDTFKPPPELLTGLFGEDYQDRRGKAHYTVAGDGPSICFYPAQIPDKAKAEYRMPVSLYWDWVGHGLMKPEMTPQRAAELLRYAIRKMKRNGKKHSVPPEVTREKVKWMREQFKKDLAEKAIRENIITGRAERI
jgi:hypothetical protein